MNGFRPIRRTDRDLGADAACEILENGYCGTLCVMGADGYPYGIPMNYVPDGNRLLFHCSAQEGHLLESVGNGCRACFTVIERLEGSRSRSAVIFGNLVRDSSMLTRTLDGIVDRYVPEPGREGAKKGMPYASGRATALVMTIDHMSAKVVDKPDNR